VSEITTGPFPADIGFYKVIVTKPLSLPIVCWPTPATVASVYLYTNATLELALVTS